MSTVCPQKSVHANDPEYICNPATGKWVKKSGPTGKLILSGKIQSKNIAPTTRKTQLKDVASTTGKTQSKDAALTRKKCNPNSKFFGNPDYICNPKTGKWVKISGPIGKKLQKEQLQTQQSHSLQYKTEQLQSEKFKLSMIYDLSPIDDFVLTEDQYKTFMTMKAAGIQLNPYAGSPTKCEGGQYDVYVKEKSMGSLCAESVEDLIESLDQYILTKL